MYSTGRGKLSTRQHVQIKVANLRTPGVEPGSQAWEACMIPLHYVRYDGLLSHDHGLAQQLWECSTRVLAPTIRFETCPLGTHMHHYCHIDLINTLLFSPQTGRGETTLLAKCPN